MIDCFNRDLNGRCLAYNKGDCRENCPARIVTVEQKIDILTSMLSIAQAKKDKRQLENELKLARAVKASKSNGKYSGWMSCYLEDVRRGERGGASEGDANKSTSMKQLMKDNRPVDVKPNRAMNEQYRAALEEWEKENGPLDRLSRTGMGQSKIDSYTGNPICFYDDGLGNCNGQRSHAGTLSKDCKKCAWLKENVKEEEGE